MVSICLNMIVKNESKIILRCLESLYKIIDYWIICDTGSTDNTKELIQMFFEDKKISGKLINEEFKNFGYNRNYLINKSKNICDYLLFIDADMILINNNFNKQNLINDSYMIIQQNSNLNYPNIRLVKNNNKWSCKGVTHEYYSHNGNYSNEILKTLIIKDINDGGSKQNKFKRDINLLQEGLIKEPKNSRYYFYLAQSYYCIQDYKNAIKYYSLRLKFKDFEEERWYSQYRLSLCYKYLDNNIFIKLLLDAYDSE